MLLALAGWRCTQAEMPEPASLTWPSETSLKAERPRWPPRPACHCPADARPTQAQGRAPCRAPGLSSVIRSLPVTQPLLSRLLHSTSQVWRWKLFSNGLCTASRSIC